MSGGITSFTCLPRFSWPPHHFLVPQEHLAIPCGIENGIENPSLCPVRWRYYATLFVFLEVTSLNWKSSATTVSCRFSFSRILCSTISFHPKTCEFVSVVVSQVVDFQNSKGYKSHCENCVWLLNSITPPECWKRWNDSLQVFLTKTVILNMIIITWAYRHGDIAISIRVDIN
jgi:hypothetical protein